MLFLPSANVHPEVSAVARADCIYPSKLSELGDWVDNHVTPWASD